MYNVVFVSDLLMKVSTAALYLSVYSLTSRGHILLKTNQAKCALEKIFNFP